MPETFPTQAGLTSGEYKRICELLGREPNHLELHLYGAMWSEHCSYKNSKPVLRQFPTRGPRVVQGPGENAGVIDLGDGLAVAFKVESHNHPSAIEPFQGAATGVGGILRDVFTMGARPIALLDSLRFGDPADARVRHLVGGVVGGVGFYGNCMGVPTVGGEVYFDDCYRGNPLVNAMCVGLIRGGKVMKGIAQGVGNPIMAVGSRTGRDGIGGAAFASEELSEASEAKRPAVQVGDPFKEKLLLEACLELFASTDAVVGIQDMGAAGLISSSCEMASRGGVGLEIDVLRVPRREQGMQPWEVMLSESQERMLVCVQKGREAEVQRIFDKWELEAAVIGLVTADGLLRIKEGDRVVGEVPAASLAEAAPVYVREQQEPAYLRALQAYDFSQLAVPTDLQGALLKLLRSPNIASREWVFRQYDQQVLTSTTVLPGEGDAAVLRLPGSKKGLALKIDCNSRYCYLNPYRGGLIAVAEAARNVVCCGAEPLAITNCLNWGNPMKPEVFWTFDQAVQGMSAACTALGTPVTGGNVSFYNETAGVAVYPTPTVGMVGVIDDIEQRVTMGFKSPGDVICVLGITRPELGGSEYLKVVHGLVAGDAPELDLELEKKVQAAALQAMRQGLVTAAHDVAEGGLAVALCEMTFAAAPGARGFQVTVEARDRADAMLFGESQSRIILTTTRDNMIFLKSLLIEMAVQHRVIGDVQDGQVQIAGLVPGVTDQFIFRRETFVNLPTAQLEQVWREGLPWALGE